MRNLNDLIMENRTREFIKKHGIVQKELAAKLGITVIALQQSMNAEKPKISTLERIAQGMGIPIWKLLLSDEEIKEIVKEYGTERPVEDARMICPRCGAVLNVRLS